jgi:hypothetical protein
MEELREKIIYKSTPIEICFNSLNSTDQYEILRLISAFPEKQVKICIHENTSSYATNVIKNLPNISSSKCSSCSKSSSSLT